MALLTSVRRQLFSFLRRMLPTFWQLVILLLKEMEAYENNYRWQALDKKHCRLYLQASADNVQFDVEKTISWTKLNSLLSGTSFRALVPAETLLSARSAWSNYIDHRRVALYSAEISTHGIWVSSPDAAFVHTKLTRIA